MSRAATALRPRRQNKAARKVGSADPEMGRQCSAVTLPYLWPRKAYVRASRAARETYLPRLTAGDTFLLPHRAFVLTGRPMSPPRVLPGAGRVSPSRCGLCTRERPGQPTQGGTYRNVYSASIAQSDRLSACRTGVGIPDSDAEV